MLGYFWAGPPLTRSPSPQNWFSFPGVALIFRLFFSEEAFLCENLHLPRLPAAVSAGRRGRAFFYVKTADGAELSGWMKVIRLSPSSLPLPELKIKFSAASH